LPDSLRRWLRGALLCAGRPARFALTGGLAGLGQLALLTLFTRWGWAPDLANATAFLLAAQLNFLLSSTFTWRDRLAGQSGPRVLWRRWLAFHGAIAGMAVVNMLVYTAARHALPVLAASALGIAAAAAGNFLLGDRLVFRPRVAPSAPVLTADSAATTQTKEVAA
jgi:putative flippase GtrA